MIGELSDLLFMAVTRSAVGPATEKKFSFNKPR